MLYKICKCGIKLSEEVINCPVCEDINHRNEIINSPQYKRLLRHNKKRREYWAKMQRISRARRKLLNNN